MKYIYPIAVAVVLLICSLTGCQDNQSANTAAPGSIATMPTSIASGRYPEFLKESLKMEVKVEDKTAWIFIANKSDKEAVPNEETHRSIVCTTELLDANNRSIGVYKEYFKRQALEMGIPSNQIEPGTTAQFGYDLTTPHGSVRVKVTYEDFSVSDQGGPDAGKTMLFEQAVTF